MLLNNLFLCILTIAFVEGGFAQSSLHVQDMERQLESAGSDQRRAELLYKWGDRVGIGDTLQSIRLIRRGLHYASGDALQQGVGYFYLGRVYMDFSAIKAEAVFDTAIHYLTAIGTSESYIFQSRAWANKGVLAQLRGDNRRYIALFLNKVIPLAAKGGDSLRVADGYTNVALPFMNYGEYVKAILYLKRSASIFERLAPRDLRKVDVYCHLAKVYLLMGRLQDAGKNIRTAAIALQEDPQSLYAPNFHAMESMYLIRLRRWTAAEQTVEKGLTIAEKLKSRYDIRQLLYQKAELLREQRKWKQAKEVLLNMYHEGYVELMTDKKQLFGDLAAIEAAMGNFKQAYAWLQSHRDISEKMYAQQTKTKIAHLEAQYNYVQKEKELFMAREKTNQQRTLIWITIFAFTCILLVLYIWFRQRKLRTAREIESLKQQQRIELGKALLEGEEKERGRLARDLHDGLGGMLAGIKLNLSQLVSEKQLLDHGDLNQTIDRLGHSVNELRRISRDLMPESLVQSGLAVALKDLCDGAVMSGLKISFRAFDFKEDFSAQVKVMIYRIIQELVYNAVKHAQASKIMVQCTQSDQYIFITVEDNGKGFVSDKVSTSSRGLKNIRNRVDLLSGKMEIDSSANGTHVNIELYVGHA